MGLMEFVDQGRGGGEADREALLAGGQSEAERNVSLAGAAVAERDDILAARNVLGACQLQYQGLVERRDDGEVEAVETLHRGEPCFLYAALDSAALAVDDLEFGQTQQVACVIDAFGGALPGQLVILTQEGRQLEGLEVMGEQQLRSIAHSAAPWANRLR